MQSATRRLSDEALRALIQRDPGAAWQALVDQYTPLIVATIRRAGVDEHDDVMDVYVSMCEQLSARGFERLKKHDGSRGSLGGWLTVVARHAVVDWIRSKKGRRRLFHAVEALPRADQRVFEMYYWNARTPSEIAELLAQESGGSPSLASVLDALARVDAALTTRHRAELLASGVRSTAPMSLEDADGAGRAEDPAPNPETALRVSQINEQLDAALRQLPREDAAIVRLKYVEGLSNRDVEFALGIGGLTTARLNDILSRLRRGLESAGVAAVESRS